MAARPRSLSASPTSWADTPFTRRLGLEVPIIQGPFGGGLSSPELTAAVSNGGGLGSFGGQPYAPEALRAHAAAIRALTDRPFAMNLWVSTTDGDVDPSLFEQVRSKLRPTFDELGLTPPDLPAPAPHRFRDQVQALLEAEVPALSFVFGVPPDEVMAACRRKGIFTLGTATTPDEARALEAAGIDVIVASGFEAGGHRGSFLRSAEHSLTGTFALVPQVADAVKVPVVAAGGIADGRGIAAALLLGAQGVQIGTAFLACEESHATFRHRELLFSEAGQQTGLTRGFSGRLARGLRNRFLNETEGFASLPYPAQGWFLRPLFEAAATQDRPDLLPLWAGQATPLLRHRKAGGLLASLIADTEARMGLRGRPTPLDVS